MRVEMFNVGWMTAAAGLLRAGDDMEAFIRIPVPAYLIETGAERILVDTGLNPAAVADAAGHYGNADGLAFFSPMEQEQSIADQVDLATITRVVLTHLHWDHVGSLALVPEAVPLVIQRAEWAAGHDEEAIKRNFYFPKDYATGDRPIELLDGDHDLLGDGSIQLLLTPGHTPGHQSVQVGDLVIGGDVTHFEDVLDDPRFPMFGDDRAAQGQSAERLRQLRDAGFRVLPGHDPEALRPGVLLS